MKTKLTVKGQRNKHRESKNEIIPSKGSLHNKRGFTGSGLKAKNMPFSIIRPETISESIAWSCTGEVDSAFGILYGQFI